jgi:hypothetical protein
MFRVPVRTFARSGAARERRLQDCSEHPWSFSAQLVPVAVHYQEAALGGVSEDRFQFLGAEDFVLARVEIT